MTTGRINQVTIATDRPKGFYTVSGPVQLQIGAPKHTVSLEKQTYTADFSLHQ